MVRLLLMMLFKKLSVCFSSRDAQLKIQKGSWYKFQRCGSTTTFCSLGSTNAVYKLNLSLDNDEVFRWDGGTIKP